MTPAEARALLGPAWRLQWHADLPFGAHMGGWRATRPRAGGGRWVRGSRRLELVVEMCREHEAWEARQMIHRSPTFFVGLHHPSDAGHFAHAMISVNRLRGRVSDFPAPTAGWLLDSGAFTELHAHGRYRDAPEVYAAQVRRWAGCGNLLAAASQDYMCEPFILKRTGLSVREHQRLTIERYDALRALVPSTHILPVIQGYLPEQYVAHIAAYGERLRPGMWVGVGSVCKRNGSVRDVAAVLRAIKAARPDLHLHGFGLKSTAYTSAEVLSYLHSADSMAWSYAARREGRGRDANDWREAARFVAKIEGLARSHEPRRPLEELWAA